MASTPSSVVGQRNGIFVTAHSIGHGAGAQTFAKAVENLGGGDRYAGAKRMYDMMNSLDPESETLVETMEEKVA